MGDKEKGKEINALEKIKARERGGSYGSLETLWSKKRGADELNVESEPKDLDSDAFKKSRKTERSPIGKREEATLKLEKMMGDLIEESRNRWGRLEESLEGIRKELDEMRKREKRWEEEKREIKERLDSLEKKWEKGEKKEIKDIKENMNGVYDRLEKVERERGEGKEGLKGNLEEILKNIKTYLERKDREVRKRNVVIRGLDCKEAEEKELERLWEKWK